MEKTETSNLELDHTMASSIKHRKSSRNNSPSQQSSSESDSSRSSSRHPPSKHGRSIHSIAVAVVVALQRRWRLIVALLFLPLSLLLRSSARTIGLRTARDPLSFSTLLGKIDSDASSYGKTSLTGFYTLGEDYLLQNNAASILGKNHVLVSGSIQFPYIDLSSILKEDTANQRPMVSNFAQSVFTQGLFGSDLPEDSFLSYDSKLKSVIADNAHLNGRLADDHALITRCGFKMGEVPNQDRSFIVNFFLDVNEEQSDRGKRALLMGIFDGHGTRGHAVSHYIALELPRIFTKLMRQKQSGLTQPLLGSLGDPKLEYQVMSHIRQALNETFLEVDAHEPVKGTGGSTASTLFYPGLGSKVYIANVGDSTTLIARYSKSTKSSSVIFQNRKHKPHLEGERKRIEKAGGQVMIPPSVLLGDGGEGLQETSRVIIPNPSGSPFGGLALAMSRSIGDFDGRSVGLIAEPDVILWDVNDYYHNISTEEKDDTMWFAVVASDGVYDLLPPEIVVDYLGRSLYHDSNSINPSPLEACERIVREASRLWMKASAGGMLYRDDITIGVNKINFASL